MRRREFIGAAVGTGLLYASPVTRALSSSPNPILSAERSAYTLAPMALGLLIKPSQGPEATIARVKSLGIPKCFLSLDGYIGKFTTSLAHELGGLLNKYAVITTAAEVVGTALEMEFYGRSFGDWSHSQSHRRSAQRCFGYKPAVSLNTWNTKQFCEIRYLLQCVSRHVDSSIRPAVTQIKDRLWL